MSDISPATVSVIIPVYNGAFYIREAVESVFDQTFKVLEVIVVDDGSTDTTKSVVEPWIKEAKIKYIYQTNRGLAAARNAGLRLAKGKYLKFLDCDDFLYAGQLSAQVKHLESRLDHVISATDYDLEFESKKKINFQLKFRKDHELAQFIEGNPCPVHTILVRRQTVLDAGGFDESLRAYEDSDLWLRIILKGGAFEKVDTTGACYRILGESLSAAPETMFAERCKLYEKLNRTLAGDLEHLPQDVLNGLITANTQLAHTGMARGVSLSFYMPAVLQVTQRIYEANADGMRRFVLGAGGIEGFLKLKYTMACLKDRSYAASLLTTSWRQESHYEP